MTTLDDWSHQVCGALHLDPAVLDQRLVLDLARDAAHGVSRPAAPLTAYLVGVAVGRGADPATAVATVTALIPPATPEQVTAP
jgi:hypothetical protein